MPLSSGEFRLLFAFLERPGMVLTRDQLLDLTRGPRRSPSTARSTTRSAGCARRSSATRKNPALIKTAWGGGYSFAGEVTRA